MTIYEPAVRALLGTAPRFCQAAVLKLRTVPLSQGGDFEDIAVLSNVKFTITAARRIMASKTLLPDVEQEMVIIDGRKLFTWAL